MAIREILQLGDSRLRQACAKVTDFADPNLAELVNDLADTVAHARATTGYGRGIAAPQIGVMQRVVYLKLPGENPLLLVNPSISWASPEKVIVWDACLSFLEIFMKVERHKQVKVQYQDLQGNRHELLAGPEKDLAELLQHEIDHLDGVLALDRMVDIKSICTRAEFEKRFKSDSPYANREAEAAQH